MAVNPSAFGPKPQFVDTAGNPAISYKLFFYVAGSTSTKQDTYTDSTGSVANTNPIVLNALGEPSTQIWWPAGQSFKVVLAPPTDTDPPTSPIWTIDNLYGINDFTNAPGQSQWVVSPLTPTFVNATTFTLTGNQTADFQVNRRIRTVNTAGTIYSTIASSVFTTLTTVTVINDSGVLDSGLSQVSYGLLSALNPSIPQTITAGAGINVAYSAGSPTITSLVTGRTSLPINGSCQVAQQAVIAVTNAYAYSGVDMHLAAVLAGTGISGNLGQFAMTGAASSFGYGVSTGSWTTGNFNWQTRIQGTYTARFNSKTVTVAAKIFQNTGGARNFKIALYKPTTTLDTFSAQTLLQTSANTSVPSGTTTQISATFTLGASDATLGLAIVVFDADAANTVVSKSYLISDWQLKEESSASAFSLPDFYTELALCQMYYAKTFPYATAPAQNVTPGGVNNAATFRAMTGNWGVQIRWNFPVPMRLSGTSITIVTYNPSAANSSIRDNTATADIAITQTDISSNTSVNISSSASATAGNLVGIHITADCRL